MSNVYDIIGKLSVPPGTLFGELKEVRNADGDPAFSAAELDQADARLRGAGLPAAVDAFDGTSLNELMHALDLINRARSDIPEERWREKLEFVNRLMDDPECIGRRIVSNCFKDSGIGLNELSEDMTMLYENESDPEIILLIISKHIEDEASSPNTKIFWFKHLVSLGNAAKEIRTLIERYVFFDDPEVRASAIWCLGLIGEESSVDRIIAGFEREDDRMPDDVAIVSLAALGMIGSPKAIEFLERVKDRYDGLKSRVASLALRQARGKTDTNALLQALDGRRNSLRIRAAEIAELLRIEEAAPVYYDLLSFPSHGGWALHALKSLGPKADVVLPDVMRQMKICRFWDRYPFWALDLIESIGSTHRPEILVEQLGDELARFRSMDASERSEHVNSIAYAKRLIEVLGKIRYEGAADILYEATREQYGPFDIRAAAIRASGDLGKGKWLMRINRFIEDDDGEVIDATMQALSKLPPNEAVPALIHELKNNPSYRAKRAAIEALGDMRSNAAEAVPSLVAYWNEDHIYGPATDEDLDGAIVDALSKIKANPELSMRVLSRELSCPHHRMDALISIMMFKSEGRAALPEIIAALPNGDGAGNFFLEETLRTVLERDVSESKVAVSRTAIPPIELPLPSFENMMGYYDFSVDLGRYSFTIYSAGQRRVMMFRRKGKDSDEYETFLEMGVNMDLASFAGGVGKPTQREFSAEIFVGDGVHLKGSVMMDENVKLMRHMSDVEFARHNRVGDASLVPFLRNTSRLVMHGEGFDFGSVSRMSTSLEMGLALYLSVFDSEVRLAVSGGVDQIISRGAKFDFSPTIFLSADMYHL